MSKPNHLFTKGKRILLGLLVSTPALAGDDWSFSGFASLGAGRVEDSAYTYMDYSGEEWSYESDSAFGLHARGNLAERLSVTLQVVSRGHNWDDTAEFEPELDWLFLSYQLDSEWRVRLGRMRTPHYLYSETVDVGYSYVWVRPPVDVYSPLLAPFSNFDGFDVAWITDWRDLTIDLQLLAGHMERSRDSLNIEVEPMVGGNLTVQKGEVTLRYGLIFDRTDIEVDAYKEAESTYRAATSIDPLFAEIADAHSADDAWYRYQTLGARWEHGDFALIGEVFDIQNLDEGYTNNANGWYTSLQYRLGKFTPYCVAGQFTDNFNEEMEDDIQASYAIVPVGYYAALDNLRATSLAVVSGLNYEQNTWTVGVRYELLSNLSLKGGWQYFEFAYGSSGQMQQQTGDATQSTSLTTFVLDLVF